MTRPATDASTPTARWLWVWHAYTRAAAQTASANSLYGRTWAERSALTHIMSTCREANAETERLIKAAHLA